MAGFTPAMLADVITSPTFGPVAEKKAWLWREHEQLLDVGFSQHQVSLMAAKATMLAREQMGNRVFVLLDLGLTPAQLTHLTTRPRIAEFFVKLANRGEGLMRRGFSLAQLVRLGDSPNPPKSLNTLLGLPSHLGSVSPEVADAIIDALATGVQRVEPSNR